jgi:hypothetical protein
MFIDEVIAREILDSRGNPTLEVDVYLEVYLGPGRGSLRRLHGDARGRGAAGWR